MTLLKSLPEQRKDLLMVDVSCIEIEEGFNIRHDMGDLEELADSIQQNGVRVPLQGRRKTDENGKNIDNQFILTAGHRRRLASLLVVKRTGNAIRVPFQLEVRGYKEESRIIDSFTSNEGKPLTPLEQAEGVQRLIKFGWTPEEIRTKIGKHKTYVSNLMLLSEAPKTVKTMISTNVISGTLAAEVLRQNKSKTTEELSALLRTALEKAASSGKQTIKKKDLSDATVNSVAEFRKFLKTFDETKFNDNFKREFVLLKQVLVQNSMTKKDLESYFYR